MTEDCVHLKDAIEIFIRDGHLKQYDKKDAPWEDAPKSKKVEEQNPSPAKAFMPFSMSITRLEDF